MAYEFLNGYGSPQIVIQRISDLYNIETISLDYCMIEAGLSEEYQEIFQRLELWNHKLIDYDFKGSRITFNLDYGSYCSATNLLNIEKIHYYNSNPDTYKLYFSPRTIPDAGRVFEVRLIGEGWRQALIENSASGIGHKDVNIGFVTVYPQPKQMYDTNNIAGQSYFHFL